MDEKTEFYRKLYTLVRQEMIKQGINPAWAIPMTSHGMMESSWGSSPNANIYNYWGMKATEGQKGEELNTTEGYGKSAKKVKDKFLSYKDAETGVREGIKRMKEKYNAFKGEPSDSQYFANINGNPNFVYFTGDPNLFLNNLTAISTGKRASQAIGQYKAEERQRFLNDATSITFQPDATRVARPPIVQPIHKKEYGGLMFGEGGYTPDTVGEYVDAIYQNAVEESYGNPMPHYNNVDEEKLKQLTPDNRGHYDDSVKLPNHPSSPIRGIFNGNYFDLSDEGMTNPNYTLFGLIDNGDADTTLRYNGSYVLPEVTVTPKGNYYDDTYNNIKIHKHDEGGSLEKPRKWDDLSLREMSDVMAVAVRHGITSLKDIRDKWNEFADGGYIPSKAIKDRIALWEGDSMKTNRSFDAEAKDFNRVIPQSVRQKLNQEQLDALYSYGYNVGMGNLKTRVLPTLTAYTQGKAGAADVASHMWAKGDFNPRMSGLRKRRAVEKDMFTGAAPVDRQQSIIDQVLNTDYSYLPSGNTVQTPVFPSNPTYYGTPTDYSSIIRTAPVEEQPTEAETGRDRVTDFMNAFGLLGNTNDKQPLADYVPEERSMFVVQAPTHNSTMPVDSWLAEGGHLYGDGGYDGLFPLIEYVPNNQIRVNPATGEAVTDSMSNGSVILPEATKTAKSRFPKVSEGLQKMIDDYMTTSNDAIAIANGQKRNAHLDDRALRGAESHALWEKEHPYLSQWSYAASAVPFTVAAYPFLAGASDAVASTRFGQGLTDIMATAANTAKNSKWFPWADMAASSYFGADGINRMMNGEFSPETALEVMPLAQMWRPLTFRNGISSIISDLNTASRWRPRVPNNPNRYYRMVGQSGDAIEDAIKSGVIRGPGARPKVESDISLAATVNNTGRLTLRQKQFEYPMFAKGHTWTGGTSRSAQDMTRKPIVIRSKEDTGPILWQESNIDFRHKGFPGIFRPSYYGDVNASPTQFFEYWKPAKIGYFKYEFPKSNNP